MTREEKIRQRADVGDYVQLRSQLFARGHGLELGQIVSESTKGTVVVENCFTGRRHYINKGRLLRVESD